ncbi:MAG: ABC transporter substrate-binding protein [Acidimicrobiia bacterium]
MGAHARPGAPQTRRVGRAFLAVVAVAALAAGVWALSGVTPTTTVATTAAPTTAPTSTTASTTTEPAPVEHSYGGDVTIGITSDPVTLNPFLEGGGAEVLHLIGRTIWAGAVALDGVTFDPIPVLLSEIPTLENGGLTENEDGTVTVTYRIDPDAKWEDGSPVTGADFEFTYALVTNPELPIRADVRIPYAAIVPGSVEFDTSTVTFALNGPSLAYLDVFSIVVPAAQVGGSDFANDWNDRFWMSAGPFEFGQWLPGEWITLNRNDQFWGIDAETGQDLPYLDHLVFEVAPTSEGPVAGFQTGAFDVIAVPPDPVAISELEALEGVDVQIGWGPSWEHLSFQFGPGRFERNADSVNEYLDYRRAVAHAIDRGQIAAAVSGGLVPALDSPLSVMWPAAATAGWSAYQGDLDATTQALDALRVGVEVSVPGSVLIINNTPERTTAAADLATMFADAALALEVEPPEETGVYFLETIGPGRFDLAEWSWVPTAGPSAAVADVRRWFYLMPEAGGSNFSRWPGGAGEPAADVARLAGLLEDVGRQLDLEEVKAMLSEIETLMADLVVTVPLYAELNAGAVHADAVSGYRHSIIAGGDTWNAATWYHAGG